MTRDGRAVMAECGQVRSECVCLRQTKSGFNPKHTLTFKTQMTTPEPELLHFRECLVLYFKVPQLALPSPRPRTVNRPKVYFVSCGGRTHVRDPDERYFNRGTYGGGPGRVDTRSKEHLLLSV